MKLSNWNGANVTEIGTKGKINNKKLGTAFEKEFCKILQSRGYWVHFINPDATGSQPFDVIAVKYGLAHAYDCKTSSTPIFPLSRLEDNQIFAFEKWIACENEMPQIAVKYNDYVYLIDYRELDKYGKVDLRELKPYC